MTSRLVFIDDTTPGITRREIRGKWAYFAPDGSRITDRDEIDRLNAVALPPAYSEAWFAPRGDAHLLAVGYDARGRKQYRYHPDYRQQRDERKFRLCAPFGHGLPDLRKRVAADLAGRRLTRERAVASVVMLLDVGAIRVGNETYARQNGSYGATTLRNRHVTLNGSVLNLKFRGKGGRMHDVKCSDATLARCVRRMQDLPGQHLFQYVEPDGSVTPVSSGDVNEYIHETMGQEFTARNFRTWSASVLAFDRLFHNRAVTLTAMLDEVAGRLGNTPAVTRRSYVHPALVAAAKGEAEASLIPRSLPRTTRWLSRVERGLLEFLGALDQAAE